MCACLPVFVYMCLYVYVSVCMCVYVNMCVSVCFFLVCFSIAVIKQTKKKHYDQNNPGGKDLFQLVVYSLSSRECRVGIWRQELGFLVCSHGLVNLL